MGILIRYKLCLPNPPSCRRIGFCYDTGRTAAYNGALMLPESPTAADAWYDYGWAYKVSDYAEIICLRGTESQRHFETILPGANSFDNDTDDLTYAYAPRPN